MPDVKGKEKQKEERESEIKNETRGEGIIKRALKRHSRLL